MKKNNRFVIYLFAFFLLTMLLQMFNITNENTPQDAIYKNMILVLFTILAIIYAAKNKIRFKSNYFIVIFLFFISQLLTGIINKDFSSVSLGTFYTYIYPTLIMVIFILIFGNKSLSELQLKQLFDYIILFSIYMCFYNFIFNFNSLSKIFTIASSYDLKLSSFLDNRNSFAGYLLFGAIANIANIYITNNKNKFYYLSLAFIIINMLITMSRTAMLSLIIFLFSLVFLSKDKKKIYHLIIIILFLMFIILISSKLRYFVFNNLIRYSSGLTGRDKLLKIGIDIFLGGNILFGNGYVNPTKIVYSIAGNGSFVNTYVTMLVNGGIVMIMFFIISIIFSYKNIKSIKKDNKKLYIIFMSVIISYLVYAVGENLRIFAKDMNNYLATLYTILLPLYLLNYYNKNKIEKEKIHE